MYYFDKPASVVLTLISSKGYVGTDTFASVKELVQHLITSKSLEGDWGSPEQINALKETQGLIASTLAKIYLELDMDTSVSNAVSKFDETWNKS